MTIQEFRQKTFAQLPCQETQTQRPQHPSGCAV